MGFSNNILTALKKLGWGKEKDDLKIITVEDRSSSKPKEEEKPKSDEETSAVAAEFIKEEGESKSNQAPTTTIVAS
ncbi:hypothetical protein QYF36_015420 [Acer negundo]|nr:hypothetical protein QYF36_015420 [Acer negundo]